MEYVMQLLHGWEQLKISPIYFLLFKNPIKGSHGRDFVEYGLQPSDSKELSFYTQPSQCLHFLTAAPFFFFFCGTGF
jgi:hypothetical protein